MEQNVLGVVSDRHKTHANPPTAILFENTAGAQNILVVPSLPVLGAIAF